MAVRHLFSFVFVVLAAPALLSTCKRGTSAANDTFDRAALLTSIADGVVVPSVKRAAEEAITLDAAADAYASAASARAADVTTKRAAAQAAWKQTMLAWQAIEAVQVGPAALASDSPGGQGLREAVYVWPVVSECGVDTRTADQSYAASDFLATAEPAARDLGALEYLLFRSDNMHACAAGGAVASAWAGLDAAEIAARRAAYAAIVSEHVKAKTQALVDAWAAYRDSFVGGGQEALNQVFASLYYIELKVKDRKIAVPAGLSLICSKTSCPELAESRWASLSRRNVAVNIDTFAAVFSGGSGVGFDDFLVARGAGDLATTITDKITAAQAAIAALPGGKDAPIAEDVAALTAVYTAVKDLNDILKTQLITALNLRVPREGAGDND